MPVYAWKRLASWAPLVLFWLTCSTVGWARLDETDAECAQRYGKPVRGEGTADVLYHKEPLQIVARFADGKAVRLEYVHPLFLPLSEENLATLLKANSRGAEWKILKSQGNARLLYCGEKHCYAYYHGPGEGVAALYLFTEDELKREMVSPSKVTVVPEELHQLFQAPDKTMQEKLVGF